MLRDFLDPVPQIALNLKQFQPFTLLPSSEASPMPRYFLNIRDGETFVADEEGRHFPDLDHAVEEARQSARDLLADQLRAGQKLDGQLIEIADASGRVLRQVTFKSVMERLGQVVH